MDVAGPTSGQTDERVRATYRYLRIVLPLPAVWLLLSIALVWVTRGEVFDSISDYYGGPLRDVFVGALMASGVCMVAYKGASKLEDYALNFAGVNAFFVALVPNSFPALLDEARQGEGGLGPSAVSSTELLENLQIAVGAFLLVTVVFVLLDWKVVRWTEFRWTDQTRVANVLICLCWAAEVLLVAVVVVMVFGLESLAGTSVFTIVHFGAAGLLVGNLSFAAASHAFPTRLRTVDETADPRRAVLWVFRAVTAGMWLVIVVGAVAIWREVPYAVFTTEVVEVVLFLVFWGLATRSEWRRVSDADPVLQPSTPSRA